MEFTTQNFLTGLSGLVIAIAYWDFINSTRKGLTKPNRATWFVWMVQDVLMAASALKAGIGPAVVMPVVWAAGAIPMFYLAQTMGEKKPFSALEQFCLVLSGFGILLWTITGDPLLALEASVGAACIGGIPTILKAWSDPASEPMKGWMLMLTATALTALAIKEWTFESGLVPISVGILQLVVLSPLIIFAILKKYVIAKKA